MAAELASDQLADLLKVQRPDVNPVDALQESPRLGEAECGVSRSATSRRTSSSSRRRIAWRRASIDGRSSHWRSSIATSSGRAAAAARRAPRTAALKRARIERRAQVTLAQERRVERVLLRPRKLVGDLIGDPFEQV